MASSFSIAKRSLQLQNTQLQKRIKSSLMGKKHVLPSKKHVLPSCIYLFVIYVWYWKGIKKISLRDSLILDNNVFYSSAVQRTVFPWYTFENVRYTLILLLQAALTLGTVGPVPTRMLNSTNSSCRVPVCFAESSEAHRDSPMWRKPLSTKRACRKKLQSTDCPAVLQLPSLGE